MLRNLPILFGIFVVMALSNAVVPVLPNFAEGVALQGAVYAAFGELYRCTGDKTGPGKIRDGYRATVHS